MKILNIGCGSRYNEKCVNIDINPPSSAVLKLKRFETLPFPEGAFDVVYHSHLLEHMPQDKALVFLKDCLRVLKPNGIIRVVVPDLEKIASLYLEALKKSLDGDPGAQFNYEWLKLEMYDQAVRERSGGRMRNFLEKYFSANKNFLKERIGLEADRIMSDKSKEPDGIPKKIMGLRAIKEALIRLFLGREYEALKIGRFRKKGEVHFWMYDRYSLEKILNEAGFVSALKVNAAESSVPGWSGLNLDTEADNTVYKPDSLYMEAVRPGVT